MYHKSYRRRRGLRGSGMLSNLMKIAKPFVEPMAKRAIASGKKAAIRHGTTAALNLVGDVIRGRNPRVAARSRAKGVLKSAALAALGSAVGPVLSRKKKKQKKRKGGGQRGKGRRAGKRRGTPGMSNKQFGSLVRKWKKSRGRLRRR